MGYRPASRVDALLEELCVKYGFCLPPDEHARLVTNPPVDPARFTEEVLRVEGLDQSLMDESLRKTLVSVVADWLHGEKGRSSGLPLEDNG